MTTYIVGKYEQYRDEELIGWTSDIEEAQRSANAVVTKHTDGFVLQLVDDGTIECVHTYTHEPRPYQGPLSRAKVQLMPRQSGMVHRTPIDCATPTWPHHREVNEDFPFYVESSSVYSDFDAYDANIPRGFDCVCGDWQIIVGLPDAVAKMVTERPPPGKDA